MSFLKNQEYEKGCQRKATRKTQPVCMSRPFHPASGLLGIEHNGVGPLSVSQMYLSSQNQSSGLPSPQTAPGPGQEILGRRETPSAGQGFQDCSRPPVLGGELGHPLRVLQTTGSRAPGGPLQHSFGGPSLEQRQGGPLWPLAVSPDAQSCPLTGGLAGQAWPWALEV